MKQIFKAFLKKLFGKNHEQLKKTFPVYVIVFLGLHLSGIRLAIAPSVLYVTVSAFSAGVMWRTLSGEGGTAHMQQLFLLPFENRDFVFSYVSALGAYTLLTKTAGLLAVMLAVGSWEYMQILSACVCALHAVVVTVCIYADAKFYACTNFYACAKSRIRATASSRTAAAAAPDSHANLFAHTSSMTTSRLRTAVKHLPHPACLAWFTAALAAILFAWDFNVFLPVIIGSSLLAALRLAKTDAYVFLGGNVTKNRTVHSGRHALALRYLLRYLLSHKNYLLNTAILWCVACVLPLFLEHTESTFALPIAFAVLSLNTPLGILLSCDPSLEQALRALPAQGKAFVIPYCLFLLLSNLAADVIFLCSFGLQHGGIPVAAPTLAVLFALTGAVCSALLEWFFPLRGWKTENDLWHHPRKYAAPVLLLILAGLSGGLCAAAL